jgi:hypothetical protein
MSGDFVRHVQPFAMNPLRSCSIPVSAPPQDEAMEYGGETEMSDDTCNTIRTGWLTKTAVAVFAAMALADLTGCAALQNSANTLGNAAGSQVTKGGLWLLGKDADCRFDSTNRSNYSPGRTNASGTITSNGCREIPSTAAQIKLAEQREAVADVHFREQSRRTQEAIDFHNRFMQQQRAENMARQVVDTCHRRELALLSQGQKMDPAEDCVTILKQAAATGTVNLNPSAARPNF